MNNAVKSVLMKIGKEIGIEITKVVGNKLIQAAQELSAPHIVKQDERAKQTVKHFQYPVNEKSETNDRLLKSE